MKKLPEIKLPEQPEHTFSYYWADVSNNASQCVEVLEVKTNHVGLLQVTLDTPKHKYISEIVGAIFWDPNSEKHLPAIRMSHDSDPELESVKTESFHALLVIQAEFTPYDLVLSCESIVYALKHQYQLTFIPETIINKVGKR